MLKQIILVMVNLEPLTIEMLAAKNKSPLKAEIPKGENDIEL